MTIPTATTDLNWKLSGTVDFCEKGLPRFPTASRGAGLYRIVLNDGSCYIGQAEDLDDRIAAYRKPTQGVIGEYLIHHAIRKAGGATLEVFTEGDLSSRQERLRLERLAIANAKQSYTKLHNGKRTDSEAINFMIAFHEAELSRLRHRLNSLSEGTPNV